jgi:hypothetical protein
MAETDTKPTPQSIYKIIPLIMGEVGAIEKNRKNKEQNYSFRGIDDAYFAFQPLFAKHGLFVMPTVLEQKREERATRSGGVLTYTILTVKHTFYASDGSSLECITVGEAMDTADKSSNKAESAAMKYALLEVFCVPTMGDNDTENQSPEPLPSAHAPKPPVTKGAPIPNNMTQTEATEAMARLMQAFSNRGMDEKLAGEILHGLFVKTKVTGLIQAGHPFVERVLGNIAKGSYDKFKKASK